MHDLKSEQVIKRWDLAAEHYIALYSKYGDINRKVLLTPAILKMLGRIAGKNVLDAGCGEGFLGRLMAERGAFITAVDYSEKMLEIARERTEDDLGIDYLHANLEHLDMLNDDAFDIVVSCIVIQRVPDYQAAIKEMYRVLRPEGRVVVSVKPENEEKFTEIAQAAGVNVRVIGECGGSRLEIDGMLSAGIDEMADTYENSLAKMV